MTRTVLALAALCGSAMTAPAFAQDGGKGGDMARLASADAEALCGDYADQIQNMRPVLEQSGWELNTPFETPFFTDLSGTRDYDGLGTAYFYGFVESYPSQDLIYCSIDIYDALEDFDIKAIGDDPSFENKFIETDAGAYGTWQKTEGNTLILVQAYQDHYDFRYQITRTTTAPSRIWTRTKADGTGQ